MTIKKINSKIRAIIIDLIAKNHSRTFIAKSLKIKNITLERLCLENNIPLNPKGTRTFIKDTSGIFKFKNKNLYFHDMNELFYLIKYSLYNRTHDITINKSYIKITFDNSNIKIIDKLSQTSKATIPIIQSCINRKEIKFTNEYFNNKFEKDPNE